MVQNDGPNRYGHVADYTARLIAKEEVAREELAHLIRTDAPDTVVSGLYF